MCLLIDNEVSAFPTSVVESWEVPDLIYLSLSVVLIHGVGEDAA